MIAPQPIEGLLKDSLLIDNAAVVGDRHKFLSLLIAPNFPALENLAKQRGIVFASRADLCNHPDIVAEYQATIDRVNQNLANFETIKRFQLVATEWSINSGELTPSMKLKRRVIVEPYATGQRGHQKAAAPAS